MYRILPAVVTGSKYPDVPQLRRQTTGKGQAHDPLEDHLYLEIGLGPALGEEDDDHSVLVMVSESPSTADADIYAKAYKAEVERIKREGGKNGAVVYMTRRVEEQRHGHGSNKSGAGRLRDLIGKVAAEVPVA